MEKFQEISEVYRHMNGRECDEYAFFVIFVQVEFVLFAQTITPDCCALSAESLKRQRDYVQSLHPQEFLLALQAMIP